MKNYATFNSLMKHIRSKGISIKGSNQKNRLINIGYYHGYKGYRFIRKANNKIQFTDFSQLSSVIDFDEELKSILYSPLMKLETAIKSIVCNEVLEYVGSSNFSDVFQKGFSPDDKWKNYKTRDTVNASLTKRYKNSVIVQHYYNQDKPIPIWAIFEELMLGDLSEIVEVLNPQIKLNISEKFGIPKGLNTNGANLPKIILAVKDLRNAIAHNKVVYDGRYMEFKKRYSVMEILIQSTSIQNIKCETLLDDVILVCLLMKNMHFRKDEIKKIPTQIQKSMDILKSRIPNKLYQEITSGFNPQKMIELNLYISRK